MISTSTGIVILFKAGGFAIIGALLSNLLEAMEKQKIKMAFDLILLISLMIFGTKFMMDFIHYFLRMGWF